jgi:threonine/homoserine/homoserine lactone efflux protein
VGICSGLLVWGAASAVGVAAVIATSATAYEALRLAGAAYLVVLGIGALRAAHRAARGDAEPRTAAPPASPSSGRAAFRQGLFTNLLNPKIAVFYSTLLPQFVSPGDPVLAVSLLLAAIHATLGLAWLGSCAVALTRARGAFARPRVRAAMEAVTGTVLVGLGLRLVLDRR